MSADSHHRGRFAPSPTGPLHLGSLIAAVASYLDALSHGGHWLLRMEDIDPPREQAGAAESILNSLRDHGLHWHGEVLYQRHRHDAYHTSLAKLRQQGNVFRCDCTRAVLGAGGACAGRCLPRQAEIGDAFATRVQVPEDCTIVFTDAIQGRQQVHLGATLPDFILQRRDGLFAYQLAVVVDDAYQQITHIVRGSDLLDSCARQVFLQRLLGVPTPRYAHLPVMTNDQGQKLSKQNHAPALDRRHAPANLRRALDFLNQPPAPAVCASCQDILQHAQQHWCPSAIPRKMSMVETDPPPGDALPANDA